MGWEEDVFITAGQSWEFWHLNRPQLIPPQLEVGRGTVFLLGWRERGVGEGLALLVLDGGESLGSPLGFLDNIQQQGGGGFFITHYSWCCGGGKSDCLKVFLLTRQPLSSYTGLREPFFFLASRAACGILVPRPGIKPMPPAVEAWSLNHWPTREVPCWGFLNV